MLFFVFSVALAGFFMFQWKRDGDILSKNIVVMNCSFMQYSTEKDIVLLGYYNNTQIRTNAE